MMIDPSSSGGNSLPLIRMVTTLGSEALLLTEFSGSEFVNGINHFRVRAITELQRDKVFGILGQPMMISITADTGQPRVFHQMIDCIRYVGPTEQWQGDESAHIYEFELRPWFWMLSRRVNSRIFTQMSVIEIISTLTHEYAGMHVVQVSNRTSGSYPPLEYTVQYCESDMDFLRRLMERYGINFHFEMSEHGHSMVLTTDGDGFADAPSAVRSEIAVAGDGVAEVFELLAPQRQLTTGAVRLRDYNFKTSKAAMDATRDDSRGIVGADFESYLYPGVYLDADAGQSMAQRQLDAHRMGMESVRAEGFAISLGAGMKFPLTAGKQAPSGEYAVLAAHYHVSNGSYRAGSYSGDQIFSGSFEFTLSSNPIAPLPVTPQPRIVGPQTAIVTDGGEGNLDEFGRIVVNFHWAPDSVSMRCRVAQVWAGQGWGSMFIPHTGMEVVVEFLDGNPDRPLVTGCVYNDANGPEFPKHNLQSGFRTVRDNRLFFVDKDGEEEIQFRAQKDMTTEVENDEKRTIKNDLTLKVDGNEKRDVIGNVSVQIDGTKTHKVKGAVVIESQSSIELKVGASSIKIDSSSITIKAMNVEVAATAELKTKGGASATHDGGINMVIKAGMVMIN